MKDMYVADVGDGLCMALRTIFGDTAQIDCGGQSIAKAFNGLRRITNHFGKFRVFTLSHFHVDHYCGLLHASTGSRVHHFQKQGFSGIKEVFYPIIPEFRDKEEFLYDLLAINTRVFGSQTGVMEYSLLGAISRMNAGRSFRYRPLAQGDSFIINGSFFEVLWPPVSIDYKRALTDIRRALEDFKAAIDEDETTRELYNRVKEEGVFEEYLRQPGEQYEFPETNSGYEHTVGSNREIQKLPPVVEKASRSLKKAANHLSLAFFEDNRFLFLGDTESSEIRQIVDELKSLGRENFYIFITPHHGTHWHNSLRRIRCIHSITSNGSKLCSKMKPQFKEISERSLATFANGDIILCG